MIKGIILAGGSGTRLYPLTKVISKQLMPIYNKPMIYYPLANLIAAGIKEIMLITTPHDQVLFQNLLGDGDNLGIKITYQIQPSPNGIAESFILAEQFIANDSCCLILGDNLFYGKDIQRQMLEAVKLLNDNMATIFGYHVNDPKRYGVAEFNNQMQIINIEEKPLKPKSSYAITGVYFYPNDVINKARNLTPSSRGELEITDLNKLYLNEQRLSLKLFENGSAWLDTGTHDSMLSAAEFVKIIEERQNLLIGSIEYEALRQNFITIEQFVNLAQLQQNSEYGQKLLGIIKDARNY